MCARKAINQLSVRGKGSVLSLMRNFNVIVLRIMGILTVTVANQIMRWMLKVSATRDYALNV